MTVSLRKTSAAIAAVCILFTGVTACSSDKDTGDKAVTKTADEKKADSKKDAKAAGVEIPCVEFGGSDLDAQPLPYKFIWGDDGGFTLTGMKKFETEEDGMIGVASKQTFFKNKGSGVYVAVENGKLSARFTPDITVDDDSQTQDIKFTWENDRLHVDPKKEFVEGISPDQVFVFFAKSAQDKVSGCGLDLTFIDFMKFSGASEEEIAEMQKAIDEMAKMKEEMKSSK